MDTFTSRELRELVRSTSGPCVTIHMPTFKAAADQQQNQVRLRGLLRKAETLLEEQGISEAKGMLKPLWSIVTDDTFWQGRSLGLAAFISPAVFRCYRVPVTLKELVDVGVRFVVRPLCSLAMEGNECLILALSRNQIRLLEADLYQVRDITPVTMPRDMSSALNYDETDPGSQVHSGMATSAAGKQGAVFHGQGGKPDTIKSDSQRFFQLVDDAVGNAVREEVKPLLLAGVEYELAIFRQVSKYPRILDQSLPGNCDYLSEEEIHKRAIPYLEEVVAQVRRDAVARYQDALGARVALDDLGEIVSAAVSGRIDTLLVDRRARAWGVFDQEHRIARVHETRMAKDEDLLELATAATIGNGGTVYALESAELPTSESCAAILRF